MNTFYQIGSGEVRHRGTGLFAFTDGSRQLSRLLTCPRD